MTTSIPAALAGGLERGAPVRWQTPPRYGIPGHIRDGAAGVVTEALTVGETDAPWAYVDFGVGTVDRYPTIALHLDLTHPLARYLLARHLGPACRWMLPAADLGELADEYAGHSAALLACSAWRVAAGMGPIVGVLGAWSVEGDGRPRRRSVAPVVDRWFAVVVDRLSPMSDHDAPFWALVDNTVRDRWGGLVHQSRGPETGAPGRAAADAAALAAGFALLGGDASLLLPWPDACPLDARTLAPH